jgi:NTE family protein
MTGGNHMTLGAIDTPEARSEGQPGGLTELRAAGAAGEVGIGLCLSGGGYRAMLFHVGTLWRLYEAGILGTVQRISSVSGGSITAGMLGLKWPRLSFDPARVKEDFVPEVVAPIRRLADQTLDVSGVLGGIFLPGTIGDRIARAYADHLFGKATLQDLPDDPRFVINATSVQSGALWRFSKPYMGDYRVGLIKDPTVQLAKAVAASAAFPPVLSPVTLDLDPAAFEPGTGHDLQREPYTDEAVLSDGGVYDNLGLETVWKRYDTVLVSDAGGKMQPEPEPETDSARHAMRVLDIIDNQVRSLRRRQLIASYQAGERKGAYWGIRTNIADYGLADPMDCPHDRTMKLAEVPTRLKRLPARLQEQLMNWGYAVCDAALRTHVDTRLSRLGRFPYPEVTV